MREAIKKYRPETDTEAGSLDNFDSAKRRLLKASAFTREKLGLGRIVTEIFDEVAEAHLGFSRPSSPNVRLKCLCWRRNDVNSEITDRF